MKSPQSAGLAGGTLTSAEPLAHVGASVTTNSGLAPEALSCLMASSNVLVRLWRLTSLDGYSPRALGSKSFHRAKIRTVLAPVATASATRSGVGAPAMFTPGLAACAVLAPSAEAARATSTTRIRGSLMRGRGNAAAGAEFPTPCGLTD